MTDKPNKISRMNKLINNVEEEVILVSNVGYAYFWKWMCFTGLNKITQGIIRWKKKISSVLACFAWDMTRGRNLFQMLLTWLIHLIATSGIWTLNALEVPACCLWFIAFLLIYSFLVVMISWYHLIIYARNKKKVVMISSLKQIFWLSW